MPLSAVVAQSNINKFGKLIQAYLWEQSQWRALNRQKHVVYLVLPYYQEVVILFDISEKPGMFSQQLNKLLG